MTEHTAENDAPPIEWCRHHREQDHGHCARCGVAVFTDPEVGGWRDHSCPPGFLDRVIPPGTGDQS